MTVDVEAARALLARVVKADGPDRGIDQDLFCDLGLCPRGEDGLLDAYRAPHYTKSLDAAVALVGRILPHGWWSVEHDSSPTHAAAVGFVAEHRSAKAQSVDGPTPALALCSALLKAVIARAEVGDQT